MDTSLANPFTEAFVSEGNPGLQVPLESVEAGKVQSLPSRDIPSDTALWERRQYVRVGSCEFIEKGNRMGISHLAREQAAFVGASVVLLQFTPAKVRAIHRNADGRIDMSSVRADPPASLSPRGTYVVQAVFLASLATESRDA